MRTNKELLLMFERRLKSYAKDGKIAVEDLERYITGSIYELDRIENESTPVQKFIFVEDGSVDSDELIEMLSRSNPEIKVIVYRQGAQPPRLVNVSEVE